MEEKERKQTAPKANDKAQMMRMLTEEEAHLKQTEPNTMNYRMAPQLVDCSPEEKSYTAAFETGAWSENPWGTVHGGFLATAFDIAMGCLAFYYGGGIQDQTVTMQVSYLRPAPVDRRLIVRTQIVKAGKTLQYVTATAWPEGQPEKLVGSATGTYYTAGNQPMLDNLFNKS